MGLLGRLATALGISLILTLLLLILYQDDQTQDLPAAATQAAATIAGTP